VADASLMDAIQTAAAARGIPAPILYGMAMAEGGGRANVGNSQIAPAIGNENHTGPFQISDSMAAKYGGDRHNVYQAADMAARAMSENLAHFGNLDDATNAWHGGYNPKNWGPRTADSTAKITRYAGEYPGNTSAPSGSAPPASNEAPDPYLAGLPQGNSSSAAPAKDPFLDGIDGATPAPNVGLPVSSANANSNLVSGGAGSNAGGNVHNGGGGQAQSSGSSQQLAAPRSWGQWAAGLDPLTNSVFNGGNFLDGVKNRVVGAVHGADDAVLTAQRAGAWAIDHGPQALTQAILGHKDKGLQTASDWLRGDANTDEASRADYIKGGIGDSGTYQTGELAGGIAATAPLFELAPFGVGSNAARLGNLSVQGAASAGATSRGEDVLPKMAIGAAAAPVLGSALGKAIDMGAPKLADLASALKGSATTPTTVQADPAVIEGLQSMLNNRVPRDQVESFIKAQGVDPKTVGGLEDAFASKGPIKVVPKTPDITAAQAQDALGSRGLNTGIASNPGLTPDVQARTDALRQQGVPDDQALRQASIESIGANPMTAHVTRDPVLQQKTNEAAKLDTPEGAQINAQNATNNDALVKAMTGTVKSYGGAPAPGEAMQGAAEALAKSSDLERAGVKAAYAKAAQTDGEALGPTDGLKAVVTDPMNKAAASNDAATFINGMAKKLNILDPKGNGASPQALEQLRQAANEALTPTASGALKALVGKVKGAIDGSFDELGNAGEGYKAARELHSAWADKYENQDGVANLIARDPKGNFVNKDSFAAKDSWLTNKNDANAIQVIRTLQDNGSTAELDKIRAHVTQGAYDKASSGAVDQLNNGTISGKAYRAHLDSVGQNKLDALFSPEEQSHLANLGNAASTLNEKVPNTFNGSNTDSAQANRLADALAKSKSAKDRVSASGYGGLASALTGSVLGGMTHGVEGAGIGAAAGIASKFAEPILAARAAAKTTADLANAIKGAANPDVARASANDNAIRELAKTIAKARAGAVAGRSGAVVGQRRREGN